jgi:hypothetical protein
MPGAGGSESTAVGVLGALVALAAIAGTLLFGWSFGGSTDTVPLAIGVAVGVFAFGWSVYRRL